MKIINAIYLDINTINKAIVEILKTNWL